RMDPESADAIEQPWVDFSTISDNENVEFPGRNALAGGLARAVLDVLRQFQCDGFPPFREPWSHYDVTRDHAVRISQQVRNIHGIARGVSEDGALWVESDGAMRSYISGEVSLRLATEQPLESQ